jgi:hypothetical protein
MKRAVLSGAALLAAFILPGCPVYPRDEACFNDYDCPVGSACYEDGYCAPASGGRGGGSSIGLCDEPSDCKANETCGSDGRCHTGSCRFHKCVSGFSCEAVEGVWSCVRGGGGTGGAGGSYGSGGRYGSGGSQSTDAQVSDAPRPDTGSGGAGGESDAAADQTAPDAAGSGGSSDSAAD